MKMKLKFRRDSLEKLDKLNKRFEILLFGIEEEASAYSSLQEELTGD